MTRDFKRISTTLDTKLTELMKKMDVNRKNIEEIFSRKTRHMQQVQLDKFNQMEANYESQREKLIKQLDYVLLSLNLGSL